METIKIDDQVIRVSDLPESVRNLVTLYEEAIDQEVQARKDLAIREAARLELTRRIVTGYREVQQAASQAVDDAQEAPNEEASEG